MESYATRVMRHPERIACLTQETTESLHLPGEERRIVGVSGFTVRAAALSASRGR